MDERLIVLMDQGGAAMNVEYDKAGTLRAQMQGHAPIICLEGNGARPSHRGGGTPKMGGCSH